MSANISLPFPEVRGGSVAGVSRVNYIKSITAEAWLTIGLAILGVLGLAFMSQLVAPPKVLFGRSLTAIPPSLFPSLVLGALAVLASLLLYSKRDVVFARPSKSFDDGGLWRVVVLFVVMFFYAFTLAPLGFFISSALSMAAVAWLAGNRSVPQIIAVSLISPIALYLVATRGLAVSLPELDAIELVYAQVFDGAANIAVGAEEASQ